MEDNTNVIPQSEPKSSLQQEGKRGIECGFILEETLIESS